MRQEITVVNWKEIRTRFVMSEVGGVVDRHSEYEYIGRRHPEFQTPSVLANSYAISDNQPREEAIRRYRRWLYLKLRDDRSGVEMQEIIRLAIISLNHPLVLICWCSPLDCHGRVVVNAIDWALNENLVIF